MHEIDSKTRERAILVGLSRGKEQRWVTEDHLDELALLTDTAGAEVVDKIIQDKDRIDPAYFIGRGKASEVASNAASLNADMVIFDDDLSPAQIRNLERMTDKKILDRSGIILDIFARRAKTREAKTQVELAQLNYLLPRLTRQWTHLSRQVGGIGTRGPGETQLEVDRRLIRKRISTLSKELEKIKSQREVQRSGRETTFKIALVGYTNAGKSTLMNRLTDSDVFVENRLFATLDPTIRRLYLSGTQQALLIDTVGFIRKLPHHLVASFMSTLEEAAEADLLLHVIDINHPQLFEHLSVVKDVLKQLKISEKPTIFVFNKIDKLRNSAIIQRLKQEYEDSVFVSATKGIFIDELREELLAAAGEEIDELEIRVDANRPEVVANIHKLTEVADIKYEDTTVIMHVKARPETSHFLRQKYSRPDHEDAEVTIQTLTHA